MTSSQILELPGLGRQFRLGMLYNCHNHSLLSDYAIPEDVISTKVKVMHSRVQKAPEFDVISEQNVSSKLSVLRTSSNSFKLAVIAGLIKKSGAAEYFDNHILSTNVARVSLRYQQEVEITQLNLDNIKNITSLPRREATHIVVGIIQGREAFFVFDKSMDADSSNIEEQREKAYQELQALVTGMKSKAKLLITDENKAKMQCFFHGDFLIEINTCTFDETCKCFHQIVDSSETSLQTIPLRVQLLPLVYLNASAGALKIGKEVSSSVTSAITQIIDEVHYIVMECNRIMNKTVCKNFQGIFQQVRQFDGFIKQYKSQLVGEIIEMLPKKDLEKDRLQQIATRHQASPFSYLALSAWIKSRENELEHLNRLVSTFKITPGIEIIHSLDELNNIVEGIDYDNIISFEFTVFNESDITLKQLSTYLHSQTSDSKAIVVESWLENETIKTNLRSIAKQFNNLATSSSKQEKKFLVSTCSKFKHSCKAVAVIVQYIEGKPMIFQQTSPPGEPKFRDITHESVYVFWDEPKTGTEYVISYVISYNLNNDPWKKKEIDGKQTYATIGNLREDTIYNFKVQAKTKSGISEESNASRMRTQLAPRAPSQPGKPICKKATHESIHIVWNKPEHGEQWISQYIVFYKENNEHHWKEEYTNNLTEEYMVIRLHPETVYHFKVCAMYGSKLTEHSTVSPISTTMKPLSIRMRDTFSECVSTSTGMPKCYQLKRLYTMNNPQKCIAKCSIGNIPRYERYPKKVLLVVGATGAGKSTLINAIANYVLGVKWEDRFRFQLIPDEKGKSQAYSQTEWITAYTFHWQEGFPFHYSLTIIDTPGFGDTRGLKRDQHITTQIKEFFCFPGKEGINHLDDVGFVTQATQARLTPTQKYIFHHTLAIFGVDMKDNISIMATFADGGKLQVADAIKEARVPHSKCFCFNNSALFYQKIEDDDSASLSKMFWDMGMKSLKQYFTHLQRAQPVSLQLTREVLNNRHHLEAILEGTHKDISEGLGKLEEFLQEEQILQKYKSSIEKNKDFTYDVRVSKDRDIPLPAGEYVTNCMFCTRTCHYPCYIPDDGEKYNCYAMENQGSPSTRCGACPGKCSWNVHRNRPFRIERYTVVETRTSEYLKERYDIAMDGKNKHEAMVEKLKSDMKKCFCTFSSNVQKVSQISQRLDEIALQKNPLTDLQYLDLLIETEEIEKREGYLDRIKYLKGAKQQAQFLNALKTQRSIPDPNLETTNGRAVWKSIWSSLTEWCHN